MSYANKFAAAVKVAGKVLRENKETVYLPFGSEYSLLLKNLNNRRALVNVYIDGECHTPGGLVINVGQEVDFERSLKNGSMTTGNRFKFIERTAGIEQHRGVKLEDGLVRIEFQYEANPILNWGATTVWDKQNPREYYDWRVGADARDFHRTLRGSSISGMSLNSVTSSASYSAQNSESYASAQSANETGITVAGSKSNQQFTSVTMGALEAEKTVIVFRLAGETPDNLAIRKPVTVKHKPVCTSCGKHNKATNKFCSECGTALEIYA